MNKTTKTTKTALTALMLLAVATLVPACDLLERPCNPEIELCPVQNHPGTLALPGS